MKKMMLVAALAILAGAGGRAVAAPTFNVIGGGTMVGNGTGGTFNIDGVDSTRVNGGAGHFWSGLSTDGTNMTVGNYLTKSGGFSANGLNPKIDFDNLISYGNGTVAGGITAVTNTTYGTSGGATGNIAIKIEVAGLAAENELWYMQPTNGGTLKRLFAGYQGDGTTASVTILGEFSLYLIRTTDNADRTFLNNNAAGMSFTDLNNLANTTWASSNNGSKAYSDQQHFATFQDASDLSKVYVGVEDIIPLGGSDTDYNDLIIAMSAVDAVPAPPALLLAALGIPALGLARRWTRKAPAEALAA